MLSPFGRPETQDIGTPEATERLDVGAGGSTKITTESLELLN
jgi:hypothetical protein